MPEKISNLHFEDTCRSASDYRGYMRQLTKYTQKEYLHIFRKKCRELCVSEGENCKNKYQLIS